MSLANRSTVFRLIALFVVGLSMGPAVAPAAAVETPVLSVPADLTVVATGSEAGSEPGANGQTRHHVVSGPVRDFVMAIDDDFQSVRADVGGVEFPQITFIASDLYDPNSAIARRDPGALEFDVAHEIGHQWWYDMVGNDQHEHAFIDEGLTNASMTVYFGEMDGPDKAVEQIDRNLKPWYFSMLFGGGGGRIVAQPTDGFPAQGDYAATIYGKGALGFGAVRAAIGDQAYFAALRDYSTEFRFEVATPDNLLAAFERASGQDLGELWQHWFKAAEGNQDYDAAEFARLRRLYGGSGVEPSPPAPLPVRGRGERFVWRLCLRECGGAVRAAEE